MRPVRIRLSSYIIIQGYRGFEFPRLPRLNHIANYYTLHPRP
nr:MAG TPA: hypothetical protein [Caudoviricetes sp.]